MKTILTNPLIVLGDFNIANFNILRDSTLLGTTVNIDQLTSLFQDTSVYTYCLLAPRRDSTPKFIPLDYIFVLQRECPYVITTSKLARNFLQ